MQLNKLWFAIKLSDLSSAGVCKLKNISNNLCIVTHQLTTIMFLFCSVIYNQVLTISMRSHNNLVSCSQA